MIDEVFNLIRSLDGYQDLLQNLTHKGSTQSLGLIRSARLPILAALRSELGTPILLITDRGDHAQKLADELGIWTGGVGTRLFPEPNPLFYENAAWGSTTRRERLDVFTTLAGYQLPGIEKPVTPPLIITSARAVMTRTVPRREFLKACRQIRIGDKILIDREVEGWVRIGYERVSTVLEPGQFSQRGGLLDIWTPAASYPVRLDFFGDELESLRSFDPATQRTQEKKEKILVTPAREFILQSIEQVSPTINEFQIPVLHPGPAATVLDYLPPGSQVFVDDLGILQSAFEDIEEQAVRYREESLREGILDSDFPTPYVSWSELSDQLQHKGLLSFGRIPGEEPREDGKLAAAFELGERFGGRLKGFITHLQDVLAKGERACVVSRQSARLEELWHEQQGDLPALRFYEGSLSEGWHAGDLHLITDGEIFGWERPQSRQPARLAGEHPESSYADLQIGDWVVHVDYGIGRFIGLVQRTLDGLTREFLCIEYRNGDQVFVPIHQADRLTRFIGPDNAPPEPGNLGTQDWSEAKKKAQEAVQEVARDLLDLYSRRQTSVGFAFGTDTTWQAELESSFPYIDTPDQIKALRDIKRDMETPRPMDRLLCGDVGYGKTEVALRAAFKAVMDGKQVGVLVPTTVLAQQHYDTFKQRLSTYPVTVEMLSRFRSPREQDQILYAMAQGAIDIVIGTHRLISGDVQFHDLGLVIIDEEQRFGVTHKEHLKRLRTEVDVLTLTATPIPRTLYMALTGVRDISNLTTPPEERLPISTHVGPYSPKLVHQAIHRELERGGQIFFVHNRVQTIDSMRMHLERLVPEARIAVAHGQMQEHELASVMHRFTAGDVDILLSTSIIESGLDIPNANTLIVDRADAFGLAQLYQLRGRVGRGASRAYAYFFRHKKFRPTPEGEERLEVIAENTQLGAGYSIAMRDLEMRGAGELLGTRQSGHIAAVGFHLYTRLLTAAVRAQRSGSDLAAEIPMGLLESEESMPVNVDLPLSIGIPGEYVIDAPLRLRLYRRLAGVRDEAALEAMMEEFQDRFGQIPEALMNLFFQMRVKIRSEKAGLSSVSVETGQIVLRYPVAPDGSAAPRLPDLDKRVRGGRGAYWCTFGSEPNWQELLLDTLSKLPIREAAR